MEAYVCGYGLVGKSASFAVYIKDDHGNSHERIVPLKLKSQYQAEVAAIKYVCQAISNKDVNLTIKTSIDQLPQVFVKNSKGEWPKRKIPNKLIDEVRELVGDFSSYRCEIDNGSEYMSKIKELVKSVSI